MTDANLPMKDNAKMVLFGSAKSVVPIISLMPTTSFFYKLVKNWENHEDGIITMPGPTRQFFQPDVLDIGHDSPPQRPNNQSNDNDQQESPNTEQDTIVDIPQSTFSTDQDTSSSARNPTTDQSTTNSSSTSSSSEKRVADLDVPKRASVEGKRLSLTLTAMGSKSSRTT